MSQPLVIRETLAENVCLLTLNRPDKLNALSSTLIEELNGALDAVESDPAAGVVVLTGAGTRAFAAGADIHEYRGRREQAFMEFQFAGRRLNDRLEALRRPTIAAVNGYALGGGFELALCCDIIVATTSARFGLPEGLLGLSPGGGGTQRLLRSLGRHAASDLILTAGRMSGERAYQLGLASALCEPGEHVNVALQKAQAILKLAPGAVAEIKRLLRLGGDSPLPVGLALEQEVLFRLYCSDDGQEGIAAFLDKRAPTFGGR